MEKQDQKLASTLTFRDLYSMGVAALIGTGIFVVTGVAAKPAGAGLFVSFIIAGIIAIFTALSYAELSSMFPQAGASYVYCRQAFSELGKKAGDFVGAIIGWTMMTQYVAVGAAVWLGFGLYARYFAPGLSTTSWAVIIGILTVAMLYLGISLSKNVINILVFFKVLALLIFIVIGIMHPKLPMPIHQHPFLPNGVGGLMAAAALIAFGQIHIDAITTLAEEAKRPYKDIPRATVWAIISVVILYSLVGWVVVTLVPVNVLPTLSAPLASALAAVTSGWASNFVAAAGIAATITSGIGCLIGGPRVGLAMARSGHLWGFFGGIHPKFKSPSAATLICGIFAILLTLTGNLGLVSSAGVFTALVVFLGVNVSVIILRQKRKDQPRPFKIPLGNTFPILAIIGTLAEMYYITPKAILWGIIWLATGVVIYFINKATNKNAHTTQKKSA
ncbi:APC family permease [Pullulanibacillus sp. KACC 23026]|uniref:APC family permease n=1 Tax=Pullulanibacillus sp. KACC 23026 TaxID=3028315 RepID=UPI0023B040AC|nr:APC family permease [Pullulanibacillus sp. KACC 23026]WEG11070.1 APC family permease [Pullulanibacillus sp. KACC 23026]